MKGYVSILKKIINEKVDELLKINMKCSNSFQIKLASQINKEEFSQFLSKNFGEDQKVSYRAFMRMFEYEPSIREHNFIIARNIKGKLIGMIRIVERVVCVDGVRIKAAGLSSIAVDENYRHRGLCAQMMAVTKRVLVERKFDIAFLHARKVLDGFYSQYGFIGIGRYHELLIRPLEANDELITVRSCELKDIGVLSQMYEKQYLSFSGSIERSPEVWDFLMQLILSPETSLQAKIICDNEKPIGYCVTQNNKLIETSIEKKYYKRFFNFSRKLAIEKIILHPQHPFYVFSKEQRCSNETNRFVDNGGYMGYILNKNQLLEKFKNQISSRLNSGKISLQDCSGRGFICWILGCSHVNRKSDDLLSRAFPDFQFHTSIWDEI